MKLLKGAVLLILAGIGLFAGPAWATSITVNNFSFADSAAASDGSFVLKCPDLWTCNGTFTGGVFNPVTPTQYNSANDGLTPGLTVPDGDTIAFDPNGGHATVDILSQVTATNIANSTTYTLDVWAGFRADQPLPWPPATIELFAGTLATPIATLALTAPAQGFWKEYNVTYTATAADVHAGQALGIALLEGPSANGTQVNWDLVTLDGTSTAVPESSTVVLLGSGLAALGLIRRGRGSWRMRRQSFATI